MSDYDDELELVGGRISINFSPHTKRRLDIVARALDMKVSTLVKALVEHGLIVEGVLESHGEIIARSPDGKEYRLVRTGEDRKLELRDDSGVIIWSPRLG